MDFDATTSIADHPGLTYERKKEVLSDNPRELLGV